MLDAALQTSPGIENRRQLSVDVKVKANVKNVKNSVSLAGRLCNTLAKMIKGCSLHELPQKLAPALLPSQCKGAGNIKSEVNISFQPVALRFGNKRVFIDRNTVGEEKLKNMATCLNIKSY